MHHLRLFPVFLQVAASHLATSLNKDTLHETELPAAFPSITAPQPVGGGTVVLLHDNTFIISWGEKTIRLGITAKSEKQGSLLIWRMVDLTPSALDGLLRRLVASCVTSSSMEAAQRSAAFTASLQLFTSLGANTPPTHIPSIQGDVATLGLSSTSVCAVSCSSPGWLCQVLPCTARSCSDAGSLCCRDGAQQCWVEAQPHSFSWDST